MAEEKFSMPEEDTLIDLAELFKVFAALWMMIF